LLRSIVFICALVLSVSSLLAESAWRSAQPLRTLPPLSTRTLPGGAVIYVDTTKGDDAQAGSEAKPLKTINHALQRVAPGGTVCLRGGTYYENVYVSVAGRQGAPITIRAFPGERVFIDGGIAEFFQTPQKAWRPVSAKDGVVSEYESVQTHRHVYQPIGSFGDSMIGLQTYYNAIDLRADYQLVHYDDPSKRREVDHAPLYCGPGIWFNAATGRIHIRLAHTNVKDVTNYKGETDPRKLPMVIAPFGSVPLTVEGSKHVVFQDLVIRGSGYDAVKINLTEHITFDNVVIWAGTYGIRAQATHYLKMFNCGVYGNIAPWTFRSDTSKRNYPGRPHRNITRLNTHALLVTDAGREFSVYATPVNDHWEISHCEWTDAHDGPYLGGINIRFHHNLIENMQDDGIYLTHMYPRHIYARDWSTAYVYQNVFRQVNMPLAFGGHTGETEMKAVAYIYRNIFDQRLPLNYSRPTTQKPEKRFWTGVIMSDHGSPPWPTMFIYHNTVVVASKQRHPHAGLINAPHPDRPRRVFNNLFVHLQLMPAFPKLDPARNVHSDGNLFWSPTLDEKKTAAFFYRFRSSPFYEQSKAVYNPGFTTNAVLANPQFVKMETDGTIENDYRLQSDSPAVNAGAALPTDWPDPLRDQDGGRPDIGALPLGAPILQAGIGAGGDK